MTSRMFARLKSSAFQSRLCKIALLTAFWSVALQIRASDFYVSPLGFDTNAGTASKPFASLERARQAVRDSQQTRTGSGRAVRVTLLGGDYIRTNSFELSAPDSGEAASPVVWEAASG